MYTRKYCSRSYKRLQVAPSEGKWGRATNIATTESHHTPRHQLQKSWEAYGDSVKAVAGRLGSFYSENIWKLDWFEKLNCKKHEFGVNMSFYTDRFISSREQERFYPLSGISDLLSNNLPPEKR